MRKGSGGSTKRGYERVIWVEVERRKEGKSELKKRAGTKKGRETGEGGRSMKGKKNKEAKRTNKEKGTKERKKEMKIYIL